MDKKSNNQLTFIIVLLTVATIGIFYWYLTEVGINIRRFAITNQDSTPVQKTYPNKLQVTSSAFEDGEVIPSKYTCEGQDINPPISISNLPAETKSLVLIMEDIDAPFNTWIHWVLFNIDPKKPLILEGSTPVNAQAGQNSLGKGEYHGPCPPIGSHIYKFTVYALNSVLTIETGSNKEMVEKALDEHILDIGQLTGTFSRTSN